MTSLDKARQGKSAIRQIQAQIDASVLTYTELKRLLRIAAEGYEQMVPEPPPPPPRPRGPFTIVRGGAA